MKSRRPLPILALLFSVVLWTDPGMALAREGKPKLGPDAVPIQQSTDYLRTHPAPDYWAISPFYVPQQTSSDCSVTSVAIVMNTLRGLPEKADEQLVTEASLLKTTADQKWATEVAEQGDGVTFDELVADVAESLKALGLEGYEVRTLRPRQASEQELAELRNVLSQNEQSGRDVVLVYFNQGVLTGDRDGPHISPVGAFDSDAHRVLVMDVD